MRVETHADARQIIHREHLRVKEVVSVRGGTRYNCITPGKKSKRKPLTILVPKGAEDKNHPFRPKTRKAINKLTG